MVFSFSKRDACCGDNLRSLRVSTSQGEFNRLYERSTEIADNLTAGCFSVRIESQLLNQVCTNLYVRLCLFEILVPFFAKIFIERTAKRSRVNLNAALSVSSAWKSRSVGTLPRSFFVFIEPPC